MFAGLDSHIQSGSIMSDGALSTTEEEANRIRASLGLSALAKPAKAQAQDAAAERARAQKQHEDEQSRRRLKEQARKRKLKEKTSGPSLGQQLTQQKSNASDWVARMRGMDADSERQKALELAKNLDKKDQVCLVRCSYVLTHSYPILSRFIIFSKYISCSCSV